MVRCQSLKEWSHKDFPKKDIWKLKYNYAGENLARNFPNATSTYQALQNSPTHKLNNESKNYQKIGIANCQNNLGNVTVFLFGGK